MNTIIMMSIITFISTGAMEMSLTTRNWPQLFKCSFSNRKKFQTNLSIKMRIPRMRMIKVKINEMTFWRLLQFAGHCQSARGGGQSSAILKEGLTISFYTSLISRHLFENESNHPEESKDDVFCHGEVVVSGAKQFILILMMNKQKMCISFQMITTMSYLG